MDRYELARNVVDLRAIKAAAQAALDYLEDDCEDHWSPEQRRVVEDLRTALARVA